VRPLGVTSAGNLISSGQRRTISIKGEIEKPTDLDNFVVKLNGTVYLKDVAKV
jgi:multidrug efflux pump subunit AcrB